MPMPAGNILVADDDAAIRTVLNQALSRAGYEVRSTSNAATLWRWVSQGEGDLVITDVVMPDENAFDLLPRIKKVRPDLPVVIMSAQNTFMTAIRASERGAYEYLPKPFDLKELIGIVGRALSQPKDRSAAGAKAEEWEGIPLVGRSAAMQEIYRLLARLMQTDLTVMITGESGTGKELVARALHDFGKRRSGPFVAINMAAIPRDLIESELFGQAEREGLPLKQLDQEALERLKRYRWPGNVRELENLARRLAALYPQETITAAVIDAELIQPAFPAADEEGRSEDTIGSAMERHLTRYFSNFGDNLPPPGLYHRILREVEGPLLSAALAATRGNQIRAADLLGVNRNTLRKKIRDLDLQVYRTGNG